MESVPVGEEGAASGEQALRTTAALDGDGTVIAEARALAAGFLARVQAEHGLPVSQRAVDLTQLVVSELVTNARKYAPGPVLLDVRIAGDMVEVVVWDSDPVLPVARAADAGRVGQHGLEIVMAVAQGFEAQREPVGKRITVRIALLDDPVGRSSDATPCKGG
ncbi:MULTISPECIES: ATP-binding protein [Streptomyces]|uniref:ATP-binding protein n=1 Tax=Streptomyces TaxID=1883 RepID=UPI00166F94CF|nr:MULTISPECIES: ATP-binding protein [Streptomyces]UFR07251.1 ATP-binding protein [Streptomyces sp. Go40/10]GGS93541.1 ATP-binding protein [Streptomyces cinerochromogenes]